MTEDEWLRCADPLRMLKQLRAKSDERKVLLLAAAYCSRVWDLLPEDCRSWVRLVEDAAEGRAAPERLNENWESVEQALGFLSYDEFPNHADGKFAVGGLAAGTYEATVAVVTANAEEWKDVGTLKAGATGAELRARR